MSEAEGMERRAGSWAEDPHCAVCATAPAIQLEPVGREFWYVCASQDCLDKAKAAHADAALLRAMGGRVERPGEVKR